MFRRVAAFLALVAVFQMMGGHWIVLQSVAWGKMLVQYSQENGFFQGAEKTFSGEHPCSMCHQVQKEVQKENSDPIQANLIKFLKQSEMNPEVFTRYQFDLNSEVFEYDQVRFIFFTRQESPLTPPPLV